MIVENCPRGLTGNEVAILTKILATVGPPVAEPLLGQLSGARATSVVPTFLDLSLPEGIRKVDLPDGPLPHIGTVTDGAGSAIGEILVWIEAGRLSGLEFAWYSDDPPKVWPPASRVSVL